MGGQCVMLQFTASQGRLWNQEGHMHLAYNRGGHLTCAVSRHPTTYVDCGYTVRVMRSFAALTGHQNSSSKVYQADYTYLSPGLLSPKILCGT